MGQTETEVPGSGLQLPFPAFALVFTDRYALSLVERLLSIQGGHPLTGCILRVLTVYVSETFAQSGRVLRVGLVPDALGADLPLPVSLAVGLRDDLGLPANLDAFVEEQAGLTGNKAAARLSGELLKLLFNAVLYATSADVEIQTLPAPKMDQDLAREPKKDSRQVVAGEVFYLPGAIDISRLQHYQVLEKTSQGKKLMLKFMVRGHWRRPNPDWKDQRMRWIAPHWKGPDLASVIERAYRLKP